MVSFWSNAWTGNAPLVGGLYVDPAMAAHMFLPAGKPALSKTPVTSSSLTGRESEVLKLIATGLTTKEIASQLDLSLSSIETYKTRATEKLGIKTRAEIVPICIGTRLACRHLTGSGRRSHRPGKLVIDDQFADHSQGRIAGAAAAIEALIEPDIVEFCRLQRNARLREPHEAEHAC